LTAFYIPARNFIHFDSHLSFQSPTPDIDRVMNSATSFPERSTS